MPNITQKQIADNYLAYLQGQNSNINASAPLSYWSIIAGAEGSVFLDMYANLDVVSRAIYIQNLQGSQIDNKLYESGLSPRGALTVSVISVTFTTDTVPAGTTITIPANTQFQSSNGITYTLFQDTPYIQQPPISPIPTPPTPPNWTPTYTPTPVTLYAIVGGSTTFVGADSTLTTTIPIGTPPVPTAVTAIVYTSIAGQNQESDQSCVNRLLLQKRSPTCGARVGDYYIYAREASAAVTDVITVPAYTTINGINSLGVIPLIGSFITENQLNAGLSSIVQVPLPNPIPPATNFTQYNRQVDIATFNIVKPYVLSSQILGLEVSVGSCTTYPLENSLPSSSPIISVTVSLPSIYTNTLNPLANTIQIPSLDINNNVITISINIGDLIKREFRRVICNQPYGATSLDIINVLNPVIYPTNFITLNDIINGLNYQLSYNNGQIAKLLLDVKIVGNNIPVPKQQVNPIYNPDGIYEGIYDISTYDTIQVSLEKN